MRFDFSHPEAITPAQIEEIEYLANTLVQENFEVVTEVLPIEEAKKSGAVALFGEKYGATVRVVHMGPQSIEFCGGTHTTRTGNIGLVSIFNEKAVSSGVRRIEAYAGSSALAHQRINQRALRAINTSLSTSSANVVERVARLSEKLKDTEKELQSLRKAQQRVSAGEGNGLQETVLENGTKLISKKLIKATPAEMRELADHIRGKEASACIALASDMGEKAVLLTAISTSLVDDTTFHAGSVMKQLTSVIGGKGGWKARSCASGWGRPE